MPTVSTVPPRFNPRQLDRLFHERELTYPRASALTGLSVGALWKLRHGKSKTPQFETLYRLMRSFGLSKGYFFAE